MRVNELIGAPVYNVDGSPRSYVIDVRTRAEHGTLVVDGLVIGRHHWRMFGYEHRGEHGPILLRWAVGALHRHTRYVSWDDIVLEGDIVQLRRDWEDLPRLPGLNS
ncbi:MAG TPA: hypothetical protein VHG10_09650 [Glycomyces sp.]|nr:hypothetical protein [Glycomyces sp.]